MLGTTLPTPIYAIYADELHFSVLTTTVIYATYAGGVLFTLVVFGRWSDAIGRRPVLLAGVACALASDVIFLMADSVPLLLVGRVVSGFSAGCSQAPRPPRSSRRRRTRGVTAQRRSRPSPTSAHSASGRCCPACSSNTRPILCG